MDDSIKLKNETYFDDNKYDNNNYENNNNYNNADNYNNNIENNIENINNLNNVNNIQNLRNEYDKNIKKDIIDGEEKMKRKKIYFFILLFLLIVSALFVWIFLIDKTDKIEPENSQFSEEINLYIEQENANNDEYYYSLARLYDNNYYCKQIVNVNEKELCLAEIKNFFEPEIEDFE